MKTIRVHEFGAPDVMQLHEADDPVASAGEAVLCVRAAGVNPVDTYIRAGSYAAKPQLPYTPGSDAAGEIESVGASAGEYSPGDRVFTIGQNSGAYAEKMRVKVENLRRLPESISFAQGAAVNVPYGTAYRALLGIAKTQDGETVMIHGGSGGVGIAAIQIAKSRGFTIIATAGSEDGVKLIEAQGAKYALNHNEADYLSDALGATCGRGADVILEMLANVNLGKDLELLAQYGRVVVIGSRGEAHLDPRQMMKRDAAVHGMMLFNTPPAETKAMYDDIEKLLESGALSPIVQEEFALQDAPRAHEAVMRGGSGGKIVLIP